MLHAQAASASRSCPIRSTPLSEADLLLSRSQPKEAQAIYKTLLQKSPTDEYARLGFIRSMLEQSQVAEASRESTAFVKDRPASGLAQLAAFEVAYRRGDIEEAFAHVKRALALAPCDGQADMGLAQMYQMTGLYATAAHFIRLAHMLDPQNQFITREWIGTLPREERLPALTAFLQSNPPVSDRVLRTLEDREEDLKAQKSGECRVVSSTDAAEAPFTAIYGGNGNRPVAYGLEVQFNNKKRVMQIDTSANGFLLTTAAAHALGLQPDTAAKPGAKGNEGARDEYVTHVHSIRLGAMELQNCKVRVVKGDGPVANGVIGMALFRRWLVTLDYPGARLRLAALPVNPRAPALSADTDPDDEMPQDAYIAPGMEDWVHVVRIGNELLLPSSLKPNGPLHYMVMETGALNSTLSPTMGKEAGTLRATSYRNANPAATGTLYVTQDTPLYIGNLHLLPDSYFCTDLEYVSKGLNFDIGGFFGLNTLQRLTIQIDYRDDLVKLTYDPKRDVVRF
ncbi:hypothetical protein GCM10022270_16540 [Terriglobus aquaticus]|nr:retroviral-like aspartic protease family protein [Terriglobus aquaticus]